MIYKTKPYKHQSDAVERFHDQEYGALFLEQGLGKTKIVLDLIANGPSRNILILAPNGLHANWFYKEIPEHFLGDDYEAYCWKGPPVSMRAKKAIKDFLAFDENVKTKFFLMNIEAARTEKGFHHAWAFLKKYDNTLVVIDESTCIKNPKAMVTKAVTKLGKDANRRFIMTGTPMTQGPLDLFSQCKFLKETATPYRTWTAFKTSFAIEEIRMMGPRSFKVVTGYRNLEILTEALKPFSLRLTKEECLDLPDKVWTKLFVEMTPAQTKADVELKDHAMTLIRGDTLVSTTIPLTTIMRLQQICSGFVTDDEGVQNRLDCGKIKALLQIAQSTQPIVIFCAFRENVAMIQEALEKEHGVGCCSFYVGGMSSDQRTVAIQEFQTGITRFFISTSAGSKGLTLTKASTLVYYSSDYKLETRLQSQDRIHRIGQTKKCSYIDLVSPGTIDEAILEALDNKRELSNLVLDDLIQLIADH